MYVLPVLLGDGVRFSTSSLGRIDLEPFSNMQSGPVTVLRFRVQREARVEQSRVWWASVGLLNSDVFLDDPHTTGWGLKDAAHRAASGGL